MNARILVFDIESTNLAANYGYILCISYLWITDGYTSPVQTIAISDFPEFKKDPTNDKRVVQEFAKVYNQADLTVAHYGSKFDLPMINTRLLMHQLPTLAPTKLRDTWRIAKDKLKLNSNRLETLISALGLKTQKTPLSGPIWVKAMSGDRKAISYVVKHCIADVYALAEAYFRLAPLVLMNTNKALHLCDPKKSVKWGFYTADKKRFHRMLCRKCNGYWKGEQV